MALLRLPILGVYGVDLYQHFRNGAFNDLCNISKVRETSKWEVEKGPTITANALGVRVSGFGVRSVPRVGSGLRLLASAQAPLRAVLCPTAISSLGFRVKVFGVGCPSFGFQGLSFGFRV